MKKLILILILFTITKTNAQCFNGFCVSKSGEGATIVGNFIVDNSLKYYQPSGFSGIGVHGGVWVNSLGFTIGGVDSKVSDKSSATRSLVFTMMARAKFFDEKIQFITFFAVGNNNYQDIGARIGYKIFPNTYAGAVFGHQMHYGLSLSVSLTKNQ